MKLPAPPSKDSLKSRIMKSTSHSFVEARLIKIEKFLNTLLALSDSENAIRPDAIPMEDGKAGFKTPHLSLVRLLLEFLAPLKSYADMSISTDFRIALRDYECMERGATPGSGEGIDAQFADNDVEVFLPSSQSWGNGLELKNDYHNRAAVVNNVCRGPNGEIGAVEEHQGVRLGDVLVSINGEPFALESFENVCEALRLVLVSDRLLRFRPAAKHYAAVSAQRGAVTVAGEGASLIRIRDQLPRKSSL